MKQQTMAIKKWLCVLAGILSALLILIPALAQTTSVSGKVFDQTGGVVPGVTVTLTAMTGAVKSSISNGVGVFQFLQLAPGTYSIKAELKGFKTATLDKLELLVDTPVVLNLKLEVGQITETVTVVAGAVRLNTLDATLGSAFEGNAAAFPGSDL